MDTSTKILIADENSASRATLREGLSRLGYRYIEEACNGEEALAKIIQYFADHGADRIFLSTEPENECGVHVYHKAGFVETGDIDDGEAVMMRMLTAE